MLKNFAMRCIGVSAAFIGILALAPVCTMAGDTPVGGSGARPKKFDFDAASWGQKVQYLSVNGHHQTAVEHYLAAPADQQALPNAQHCYKKSIKKFVSFEHLITQRNSFTPPQLVRALWMDDNMSEVIKVYEANRASCGVDSPATAAYLDAKLREANDAKA